MKVLFAGLGSIGQRHLRNLRALRDGVDVIAWRTRGLDRVVHDDLRADDGADPLAFYRARGVPTLEAGLAERPDCTFVCNPTSMHVPVALAALRAGSHVFLEKPASDGMRDVNTLAEEARQRKRVVYVGYQFRFHPALQYLETLLKGGAAGRVLAVHAAVGAYLPDFHAFEDYRHTYAARRTLGGGVVLTQSHEIDYLCHLFGVPKTVYAVGGHLSALEIDVEDFAAVTMDCGTSARALPVTLTMDFLQKPAVRRCEVLGEEGKIVMDIAAASLIRFGRDGSMNEYRQWPDFRRNDMYLDQLRHFLACCAGMDTPRVDLAAGTHSLQVALAILRSIETRAAETVTL